MPAVTHSAASPDELATIATAARRLILQTVSTAGTGHLGADLSAVDILTTLYFGVLDVSPDRVADPGRDRFVLSKSHASAAMYSVLCLKGFLSEAELATYAAANSRLTTVVSDRVPGVEFSTGSLGHGLPLGVGAALAARLAGSNRRTVVLTGDGELQEGSNWEAAMLAATKQLTGLTVIVDRNLSQKGAATEDVNSLEPLDEKWRAFGWAVRTVDGHDYAELLDALRPDPARTQPTCLIARTVKGKGVAFMQGRTEWHSKKLTPELLADALAELGGK